MLQSMAVYKRHKHDAIRRSDFQGTVGVSRCWGSPVGTSSRRSGAPEAAPSSTGCSTSMSLAGSGSLRQGASSSSACLVGVLMLQREKRYVHLHSDDFFHLNLLSFGSGLSRPFGVGVVLGVVPWCGSASSCLLSISIVLPLDTAGFFLGCFGWLLRTTGF